MKVDEKHQACDNKANTVLYKIGMFAAMNRVTVKALRFYEEKGLLLPAYINEENGYRYYTLNQMADMHQISALKQAGFTLDDIFLIRSGTDEEKVIHKKKSELINQIAELTKQVAVLDGYLAMDKETMNKPVLVKEIPKTTVAYMSDRIRNYDRLFDFMPEMGMLMEQAGCECAMPEYCFTNYLESEYKDEDILVEVCEAVTCAKEEIGELKYKEMPQITAACAFHKGSYDNLDITYKIILKYIEDNGYEVAGPIRESYIDGVWNKDDESDWLTEIQIPVISN